jgi:hypothetical protein
MATVFYWLTKGAQSNAFINKLVNVYNENQLDAPFIFNLLCQSMRLIAETN